MNVELFGNELALPVPIADQHSGEFVSLSTVEGLWSGGNMTLPCKGSVPSSHLGVGVAMESADDEQLCSSKHVGVVAEANCADQDELLSANDVAVDAEGKEQLLVSDTVAFSASVTNMELLS
jgi:hypothetical protein